MTNNIVVLRIFLPCEHQHLREYDGVMQLSHNPRIGFFGDAYFHGVK